MKIIYIIVFSFLFLGCVPTQNMNVPIGHEKIITKTQKVIFTPKEQILKQSSDFEITIMPIDARELDTLSLFSSTLDGNYNKSNSISIMEKLETHEKSYESTIPSAKLRLINVVRAFYKEGKLTKNVAEKFLQTILNNGVYKEIEESTTNGINLSNWYNPYKIDEYRYYSLFSFKFKNSNNEIQKINIDNILLTSGLEQLYPLKMDFFENKCKDNVNQLSIAQRLNMPNILILPPHSEVIKYVAFQPLNVGVKDIEIHIINSEKLESKVSYSVNYENKMDMLEFEEFMIIVDGIWTQGFYVMTNEANESVEVNKNHVFIPKNKLSTTYNLYGLLSRLGNTQKYENKLVKLENIRGDDFIISHIFKPKNIE